MSTNSEPDCRIQQLARSVESVCAVPWADPSSAIVQSALADLLTDPATRRWLSTAPIVSERPVRPLWIDQVGRFSILLFEWRNETPSTVHDHWCWGVVGVVCGVEEEARYRALGADRAALIGRAVLTAGETCAFPAGPAGIHRVRCLGAGPARSLHIYGGDVSRTNLSSIDRIYSEVAVTRQVA